MTDTINPPTGAITNGVTDTDPNETEEWLDALRSVLEFEGGARVHYLLARAHQDWRAATGCTICWTGSSRMGATRALQCRTPLPLHTSTPFRWKSSRPIRVI